MAQEPEVQEEDEVEESAPKKSNKKLIIIAAAVLVLIIGGLTAWLLMGGDDAGEHADGEEKAAVVESKEPVFVELETFTVNLNPEEGEKYLQTDITLNASSKEEAEAIELQMPQVRNRILMILTSKLASEISTMEGKETLSMEIVEHINEPYSEGGKPLTVKEAFFTSFVIQ